MSDIDLDKIMSEAISDKKRELGIGDEVTDTDIFDNTNINTIDNTINSDSDSDSDIEDRRGKQVTRVSSMFKHSVYGILLVGPHKGREVEVKYYLPGKLEVEVGINEELISKTELNNGDVVNNCVILAKIGRDRYLGHCKKVAFLDENDVIFDGSDIVEIIKGPLFGIQGKITNIHKTRVGVIVDKIPLTVDTDQIFYKDLLLKNGKYFHVVNVELDGDNYVIDGVELGGNVIKRIGVNDINEMMSGFKLGKDMERFHIERQEDDDGYSLRHSEVGSEIGSESDNLSDILDEISDENETFDMGDLGLDIDESEEGREKATFRDVERTSKMFSGWTSLQKRYLDIIKRVFRSIKKSEDLINVFDIINKIESVLNAFDRDIVKSGENFDIYSSSIDLQMIIACCVAYELVSLGEFSTFLNYINTLYNSNYFTGSVVSSVLVELPEVFVCSELKRTKVAFERIRMLMMCFNRLIQDILGIKMDMDKKKVELEYEPVVRKEKLYERRGFILPEEVVNDKYVDVSKRVLWSPVYTDRINKWREMIVKKVESSSGITKRIYDFIEKNIETSPIVLMNIRDEVKRFLLDKKGDILSECDGDKKCEDVIIKQKLDDILFDVLSNKMDIDGNDYEMIHKYIRMNDFVSKFFEDIGRLIEYNKTKKQMRLEEVESERVSILKKRRDIQEDFGIRDKITGILKGRLGERFDENCLDNNCKMSELMDKVRRVLNTQEQMLLNVNEVKIFRDFVDVYGEKYPIKVIKKLPRIILKFSKK